MPTAREQVIPGCNNSRSYWFMGALLAVVVVCLVCAIFLYRQYWLLPIEITAALVLGFHPGCWLIHRRSVHRSKKETRVP